MRFASLFSGIGGFDKGLEDAGMECVAQVEWDKKCQAILERHWPDVPRFGDVTSVRGDELGDPDLICGGWPCQDISIAGLRAGLAGERSGLFHQFMRLVTEIRPTWVLAENVYGLLSSNGGRDMGTILGALGDRGYGFAYRLFDARSFGVPQKRRRVFIVGHLGDARRAAEVLRDAEGSEGTPRPSEEEGLPDARAREDRVGASVVAFAQNQRDEIRELPGYAGTLAAQPGMKQQTFVMRWREGKPGGGKGALISADSLTLATSNDQILFSEDDPRRFTPVETERLQGFPDNWTAGLPDTQRYKQTGNAVPVPVAHWIGKRIMEAA